MANGRPRVATFRVPLWVIALALIPIGIFLVSLLAAGGIALLAVAAFALLGRLFSAPRESESLGPRTDDQPTTIELDPSEFRRLPDTGDRDRR